MKNLGISVVALSCLLLAGGCQHADDTKDNASMRDTMTGNHPFDINKVPPEYRQKVMQMRGGGGGNPAATSAPAKS